MEGPRSKLDYASAITSKPTVSAYQLVVAYALMAAPIVYSCAGNSDNPLSVLFTVVSMAVAAGASLFIVRRRPNHVLGWFGLVLWGLLTLVWLVVGLVDRLRR